MKKAIKKSIVMILAATMCVFLIPVSYASEPSNVNDETEISAQIEDETTPVLETVQEETSSASEAETTESALEIETQKATSIVQEPETSVVQESEISEIQEESEPISESETETSSTEISEITEEEEIEKTSEATITTGYHFRPGGGSAGGSAYNSLIGFYTSNAYWMGLNGFYNLTGYSKGICTNSSKYDTLYPVTPNGEPFANGQWSYMYTYNATLLKPGDIMLTYSPEAGCYCAHIDIVAEASLDPNTITTYDGNSGTSQNLVRKRTESITSRSSNSGMPVLIFRNSTYGYAIAKCAETKVYEQSNIDYSLSMAHVWEGYNWCNIFVCEVLADVTYTTCSSHTFIGTCGSTSVCKYCGISGGRIEHQYSEATCTQPAICTKCGIRYGSALGHSYQVNYPHFYVEAKPLLKWG